MSCGAAFSTPERNRGGLFRNNFRAVRDWGGDLERWHCQGDPKGALVRTPQKPAKVPQQAGASFGNTLETAESSVECLACSPPAGKEDAAGALPTSGGATVSAERLQGALPRKQECATSQDVPEGTAETALWSAVERLRAELAEERERRRGRQGSLDAQAEALQAQRTALSEEQRLVAAAEERRLTTDRRAYALERQLAQLQECHHALLSRKAMHEVELRQRAADAADARAADQRDEETRAAEGWRAWARTGPEMEALKEAKLELAQVLGFADEARLHHRWEMRKLQDRVAGMEAANKRFQLASDGYAAPDGSFHKSLWQLFAMARGRTCQRGAPPLS